ncbi:MAG TPA: ATP-binding protein, partial [Aggregatilineales bacterium]|nr:ATP-binding protein [Aggregatilineales bacterium]
LQRKRHATTRVIDLSTRRTLHDEVLPALHMAILQLNGSAQDNAAIKTVIDTLAETHTQISNLIHTPQQSAFDLVPGGSITDSLRGIIDNEFKNAFHRIEWKLQQSAPEFDELTQEVILHAAREAVRNAAVHARGDAERQLNLCIESRRSDEAFSLCITDDGVGLNYASSGSGSGLALHSTMLAIVGGYLIVEPEQDSGTRVEIRVPLAESTAPSET